MQLSACCLLCSNLCLISLLWLADSSLLVASKLLLILLLLMLLLL
jgi:hypothetical protein